MTKLILDSGDPIVAQEISDLAKKSGSEIWGVTTNPTLIAQKLTGKKLTQKEAFALQKDLVLDMVKIVPGAVSAEVYADHETSAEDMTTQGLNIATWHERVIVKLPTTLEGFKARTNLRKEGVPINNTLVFSQEQVFAISMHEKLMKEKYGKAKFEWPCFISPFIGRLDERGISGLSLVENALRISHTYFEKDLVWMLEASVRNVEQMQGGIELGTELMTVRPSVLKDWFALTPDQQKTINVATYKKDLKNISQWIPSEELLNLSSVETLMAAIENSSLDITHPLTTAGIDKFVADWQAILS